jgi:hypothetical protein
MANPRNDVRFLNVRTKRETYKHDDTIVFNDDLPGNSAQVGRAVTMVGEAVKTVSLVAAGERVAGRLELVEGDGNCVVTVTGNVELPAGTGALLVQGLPIMGALLGAAEGYIDTVPAVATAASAQNGRGQLIDGSTTTKCVVLLD